MVVDNSLFSQKIIDCEGSLQLSASTSLITLQLDSVCAGYAGKLILVDLSLLVRQGEIVALMGVNGSGKSTLIKVVAGLANLSSGRIWHRNCDISTIPVHERVRRGISYQPQGGEVFPSLTVRENLLMSVVAVPPRRRQPAVDDVFDLFPSLREKTSKRAGALSGGERQLLACGMAVARQSDLLLLDEPTAGMSASLSNEVIGSIREVNRSHHKTILVVEQRVKEIARIADRLVELSNGTIVDECRPGLS